MDNLILEALVAEARPRLVGHPVWRVAEPFPDAVVIFFDDPGRSRLLVSAETALGRLHLTRERAERREAPVGFAALAGHHLAGAILIGIEKEPAERIVRLRFAGASGPGKSLIAELLGRSSNVLLLDPQDRILGALRRVKSEFRRPEVGAPYEPPRRRRNIGPPRSEPVEPPRGAPVETPHRERLEPTRGARVEPPHSEPVEPPGGEPVEPRALGADALVGLVARSRRESHPLSDLLLVACPAIGALAAREIERRSERGEDAHRVLQEWLDRCLEVPARAKGDPESGDPAREAATSDGGSTGSPRGGSTDPPRGDSTDASRADTTDASRAGAAGSPPGGAGGFVYAPGPLDAIDPRRAPGAGRVLLSPLPLVSADPDLLRTDYPSFSEAADVFYGALASGAAFRSRRDALAAIAKREARRAHEIAAKVARDLQEMEQAGRYRIYGEALLAGLTRAQRRGEMVDVPDPYDPDEKPLAIPIDPALSLQANAERYFRRHRKAERGRVVAERRRAEQAKRSIVLAEIASRLDEAAAPEDLDRAEEAMRAEGIAVGLERRRPSRRTGGAPRARVGAAAQAAPAATRESGVRLFTSSDGWEILVGKGGNENDRLTFKVASPEDFWLHAEGAAGAHVVVRNPRSEPHLPAATLREAAALAAFYSKAKEQGRAEVIVTRRKYVRRIRGAPRGTVTVKKHTSVAAVPKNPFEDTSRS